MRVEMIDVPGVIENECSIPGVTQRSVALSYAFGLRQGLTDPEWKRCNEAIVKRWPNGLSRVKEMAWKRMEA